MASANPSPVHTVRTAVYRTAIGVFRRLPLRVRRQLVRVGTPNYTLGSVVLLRDGDDRLLLVRQPPAEGWSLPGGLLDRREHPRDAAVREVREEIGVELDPESVTPIVPNAHVNPWVQQVDLIFTATVDADAVAVSVDGVEIGEAEWFTLDALPRLTGPTFRLLGRAGLVAPEGSADAPSPSSAVEARRGVPASSGGVGAGGASGAGGAGCASGEGGAGSAGAVGAGGAGAGGAGGAGSAGAGSAGAGSAGAESTGGARAGGAGGVGAGAGGAGAILGGGAERTDAVLAEPGEAFADPEETRSPAPKAASESRPPTGPTSGERA